MGSNDKAAMIAAIERSVLGAAILSEDAYRKVCSRLRPADFASETSRKLFHAIGDELEEKGQVDKLCLAYRLESIGVSDSIGKLENALCQHSDDLVIDAHISMLLDEAKLRNIAKQGKAILSNPAQHAQFVQNIADESSRDFAPKKSSKLSDVMMRSLTEIERLRELDTDITGIRTPWAELNEMTGGLQPGDLILLGARPSMGKTMGSLNFAEEAAIGCSVPTMFVSLEMGDTQIANRLLSAMSGVPATNITRPRRLTDSDFDQLMVAVGKVSTAPFYLEENLETVPQIRQRIEELNRENEEPIGLVVIDYLQLLLGTDDSENRTQEVGNITRTLKRMARKLGVAVVLLSQLSRKVEDRTDKRPINSDLRESGNIEQDADVIMMLYRDEYYRPDSPDKGIAELIVTKQRNGPLGTVRLAYMPEKMRFGNLAFSDHPSPDKSTQGVRKNGPSF